MILYGASGHCKVIIELLEVSGETTIVIWDDGDKENIWQYAVCKPVVRELERDRIIISIGSNEVRKRIAERLSGNMFGKAIHPRADISERAQIGDGTVVMAGVSLNADIVIGKHCIINTNASIDHDCVIADYCHLSPNSTLCGNVKVGEGTHIGAGATVIPGITIGKWCTIGAGATIIADVPDFATVVGTPGKVIKITEHIV